MQRGRLLLLLRRLLLLLLLLLITIMMAKVVVVAVVIYCNVYMAIGAASAAAATPRWPRTEPVFYTRDTNHKLLQRRSEG